MLSALSELRATPLSLLSTQIMATRYYDQALKSILFRWEDQRLRPGRSGHRVLVGKLHRKPQEESQGD